MTPTLAVVDPAGNHMPEMGNHASRDKELSLGIVVDTPGIAEAVGDHLEAPLERMVAPDTAIDVCRFALEFRLPREGILVPVDLPLAGGLADPRRRREALAAIEPSIRPPVKAVEGLVAVTDPPARQADLDILDIGLVIPVAVGNVEQVRRRAEPETVKPYRHRRREGDAFEEDLASIEHTVPIGILQDQDAAVARVREPAPAALVITILGEPHSPTRIPAEGHRLGDHRLRREDIDLKAVLHLHLLQSLEGSQGDRLAPLLLRESPQHRGVAMP